MKKILIILFVFFLGYSSSFSYERKEEVENEWLTHSYNYGVNGRDCSNIYYNYGTPEFTVNSEDPDLLKRLYETCLAGKRNGVRGNSDHPGLLDKLDKGH